VGRPERVLFGAADGQPKVWRMIRGLKFHPRAWRDSLLTYPRFLGTIKPELMGSSASELGPRFELHGSSWWPKQLECPVAKKILVISPHPDDESIGCGGLLLAHVGNAEIQIVTVYNGDGGGALEEGPWISDLAYRDRLVEVRRRELEQVAAALQASKVTHFDVSDCDGVPGSKEIAALRGILRDFAPEVVLLPWLLDKHPHHRATNRIFAEAAQFLDLMVLGYEIWGLLSPNAFFDISNVLDRKRELISLYASQLRTVDYIGFSEALARMRAFHHPVNNDRSGAVEAFVALPCRDYCDLVQHSCA
jgi:N-acetylglucosamine malate deacetylase 1